MKRIVTDVGCHDDRRSDPIQHSGKDVTEAVRHVVAMATMAHWTTLREQLPFNSCCKITKEIPLYEGFSRGRLVPRPMPQWWWCNPSTLWVWVHRFRDGVKSMATSLNTQWYVHANWTVQLTMTHDWLQYKCSRENQLPVSASYA